MAVMQGNISYVPYRHLDKVLWDKCIDQATNGLVYAYSFYLDAMAKHWDALVWNEYEAVMPLTYNKKYGIHYLYQPPFTAALGVFGKNVTTELVQAFLQAVPKQFSYWDISLNHGNFFGVEGFELYRRSNYILSLHQPYEVLYAAYRDNIKRNIKKSVQQGCTVQKDLPVQQVIALAKEQANQFSRLTDSDFAHWEMIYQRLHGQQRAITYGIVSPQGALLASCAFFFSHGRAYYILVGNHPNGKTLGASHALIDAFIKDHANTPLLLDFEGSDIRNLAFFYGSFGATEEQYPGLRLNRLPWWAKWLKR
jgi:hypothetical protein